VIQVQQLTVGSMGVCCYILSCPTTQKAGIVDPGGDVERILAAVSASGVDVQYIIATHGHPDHVCGNRALKDATGADIIMHRADEEFFGQPDVSSYFSMLGLEPSPPADVVVEDGDIISIGEQELQVIHTPGHTPGGICLLNGKNLVTGDTLFVGGLGRTDFPGGSHPELMNSIRTRLLVLPDDTVIWPGHGYGGHQSTIGEEKRSNPFL
jgi:glyoxylase-like metal-dependent hydrolase (beta-lactamase superfamily II)